MHQSVFAHLYVQYIYILCVTKAKNKKSHYPIIPSDDRFFIKSRLLSLFISYPKIGSKCSSCYMFKTVPSHTNKGFSVFVLSPRTCSCFNMIVEPFQREGMGGEEGLKILEQSQLDTKGMRMTGERNLIRNKK